MMDILAKIVTAKRAEVAHRRADRSVAELADAQWYSRPVIGLKDALEDSKNYGIITEFKRKSPSQADINLRADPVRVTSGYRRAGATALSVLTDYEFFGAHPADFASVRERSDVPMIRKDFIIDPYQVHEARAMGADAILLIAACLDAETLDQLATTAKEIGLDVLCEVHDRDELARLSPAVDVVGVNNRNLKDFSVSIDQSLELGELIPPGILKISESGIEDPQSVVRLWKAGFRGFLIGTYFMRNTDPGQACTEFIAAVSHHHRTIDHHHRTSDNASA